MTAMTFPVARTHSAWPASWAISERHSAATPGNQSTDIARSFDRLAVGGFAVMILVALLSSPARAQTILFDFENAPVHTPLPIALTVGGITAQFSATGQGFSIQPANSMGFTPVGFSGNCIYPSSVFAADLHVSFSQLLTDFSILYAPQELACDSSATMRVTAYQDGVVVGTATTNAVAGTWPSETLRISLPQGFNSVVVHYDKAPVTGGDYGPIFMADNMMVTPVPPPIVLSQPTYLANGAFQFTFTNTPSAAFTVYATASPTLPLAVWTPLSGLTETSPGHFQFIDPQAAANPRRFYRVTAP
jgi:hypothetical protein